MKRVRQGQKKNSVYSENCIGGPNQIIRSPNITLIVSTHFPIRNLLSPLLFQN